MEPSPDILPEITYYKPFQAIGRPMNPEILFTLGAIKRLSLPKTDFDPEGDWDHTYCVWCTEAVKDKHYEQGQLRISRRSSSSKDLFSLDVCRVLKGHLQGEQLPHILNAQLHCANDLLASPCSWNVSSRFLDSEGKELAMISSAESGQVRDQSLIRTMESGALPEKQILSGAIASDWGLFDAVQRMPFESGESIRFELWEECSLLKKEHNISYLGSRQFQAGEETVVLYGFQHTGRGVLPYEYWLNEAHRLLFVMNCNRIYILEDLIRYPGETENGKSYGSEQPLIDSAPTKSADSVPLVSPPTRREGSGSESAKPNILLIITDQQHIDTISAGGCPYVRTPAMDSLYERGVRFTQSYCTNPLCSPSRSSMMSGRMPSETGVIQTISSIDPSIPTLGRWFSEQSDYETVYAGKWHILDCHTYDIPGFHVLACGQDHRGDVSDPVVSRVCEAYLRNRTVDKPFLLVASLIQPHDICSWLRLNQLGKPSLPYDIPETELPPLPDNFDFDPLEPAALSRLREEGMEPTQGRWSERDWRYYLWSYYRQVEMVDAEINRILEQLQRSPYAENTLVIFTSDHGEGMAEHHLERKNYLYEGAVKVPLIAHFPGRIRENVTDSGHLVSGVDIMPTLCDFAGIDPPPNMAGQSLRPLLEGKLVPWRSHVAVELGGGRKTPARKLRTERYTYVKYKDDPLEQLFDLVQDPGETVNLSVKPEYQSVLDEHRSLLLEWERRLSAPEHTSWLPK